MNTDDVIIILTLVIIIFIYILLFKEWIKMAEDRKGMKASTNSDGLANGDGIVYPPGRSNGTPEENERKDLQERADRERSKD